MLGLLILAAVGWVAPWRVKLTIYAALTTIVLVISHGHLAHW